MAYSTRTARDRARWLRVLSPGGGVRPALGFRQVRLRYSLSRWGEKRTPLPDGPPTGAPPAEER